MPERQPKKYERRLDALAEILQGSSACVAVANVGGRFLITANERFNNREHLSIVQKIMSYFQNIATHGKEAVDHNVRDRLLTRLYYLKMETTALGKGVLKISKQGLVLELINSSKMAARHWPTEAECDAFTENNLFLKACIAYALMRDLYRYLVKIENGLVQALYNEQLHRSDQEEVAITHTELQAFRNFKKEDLSVTADFIAGDDNLIHAEMQILGFLLRSQQTSPIYIGISKRCCWDCHCMITATNEVLGRNDISLRANVRDDAHDGRSDPWNKPKIFTLGNIDNVYLEKIIKEIDLRYNELKRITRQSRDYVQSHSRSSSEASLDYMGKKAMYLKKQETRQQILSDLIEQSDHSEQNFSMKQNLNLLDFSIQLCDNNCLEDLFKISEQDDQNSRYMAIVTTFSAMLTYCDNKKIDIDMIKIFIKTPEEANKHFPDVALKGSILIQLNTLYDKHKKGLALKFSQDLQPVSKSAAVPLKVTR